MDNGWLVLLFFVISIILEDLEMKYLSVQILMMAYWCCFLIPGEIISEELSLWGYPRDRYRNMGIFGQMACRKREKNEKVPIEVVWMWKISSVALCVFSLLLWTVGIKFPNNVDLFSGGYALFTFTVTIILMIIAYRILFFDRFKRLTIHNLKYYFFGGNRFKAPPQRTKLEKC